jgi:molybdopterin-guanine dinucleotide biosynthesis protein A
MQVAEVSGYVLAGGKSSRMGQDKALLQLAGKPLIARAVERLAEVCETVSILSGREEFRTFGRLVRDVHPGCGPLGGMEAALLDAETPWCLFLAVDMPFVPARFLGHWAQDVVGRPGCRIALFTASGKAQPTLCLVHREALPSLQAAIQRGDYKVFRVFSEAAAELAMQLGRSPEEILLNTVCGDDAWFRNLNTAAEFAEAERQWGTDEQDPGAGAS